MDLVFDLCRSLLDMGFEKLAILDCHGRHDGTLDTVSQELCDATDKAVAIIKPLLMANHELNAAREFPPGGALHGCEFETSRVLDLSPEVVNISKATIVAHFRYHPDFIAGDNCLGKQKATLSSWYIQPGQTGAYGGPTVATAEMNKLILDAVVASDVLFSRSIGRIENRHSRFPTREGVLHREGFRREDEPCLRETAHA